MFLAVLILFVELYLFIWNFDCFKGETLHFEEPNILKFFIFFFLFIFLPFFLHLFDFI